MSAFDHRQRRKAIWLWNQHKNVAAIADLMGERAADVEAFLETCRDRGYPSRIDVNLNRRTDQDRIDRRTTKPFHGKLAVFDIVA